MCRKLLKHLGQRRLAVTPPCCAHWEQHLQVLKEWNFNVEARHALQLGCSACADLYIQRLVSIHANAWQLVALDNFGFIILPNIGP